MAPIFISVTDRSGKKTLAELSISSDATVDELKAKFAAAKPQYYPARQRFSLPPKAGEKRGEPLKDGARLSDYGLKTGETLHFKDLGPQIGYSTVFFFEYLGPMLIYPLFYLFPAFFYPSFADRRGGFPPKQLVQTVACGYWVAHYAKRIAETFLVHRFGHATMPISNLFKNCSYYYGFAAFVAYFVNHPRYTPAPESWWLPCFAAAALCQLSNLYCHVLLSNLRKPGDKGYSIPRGFLFNYITCANYSAEIWGWTLFTLGTRTAAAAMFTAAGAYQMAIWAKQKHRRLQKIFDGKEGRERYPSRWIMLPPFF